MNDGLTTTWQGGSGGGGNNANVAGAQEVVVSTSGGLGEAEKGGVIDQPHPARGRQHLQRHVVLHRRERRDAGEQLHAGAEGPGPARRRRKS